LYNVDNDFDDPDDDNDLLLEFSMSTSSSDHTAQQMSRVGH